MKALSLTQPWATLMAIGAKRIETRSWSSNHRGWVAIHASKGFPRDARDLCYEEPFAAALAKGGVTSLGVQDAPSLLPLGAIVAVGNLHRVGRIGRTHDGQVHVRGHDLPETDPDELAFGDYTAGRYGWVFTNVGRLATPVPCRGALSLWDVPADVMEAVQRQLPALNLKGR